MTFASVCSGIEGASVAWHPLGWESAWYAEIDPFASAVLAHRFPEVPNRGDFTQIENDGTSLDVLIGGTPCQDFSVAGLRAGLAGERGALTIEFVRLLDRLRPRWFIWENVPGVLSCDGGRAFGTFLRAVGDVGYGFAYRVLDAQFFGVPQRRRRVFVVGRLGDWRGPAAVLIERSGLLGHPPPRRKAGPTSTFIAGTGVGGGGGADDNSAQGHHLVAHTLRAEGFDASEDGTGCGISLVAMPFDTNQITSATNGSRPEYGQPSPTLATGQPPAIAFSCKDHGSDAVMKSETDFVVLRAAGVRRLTPREYERLQGFPDDWTAVPYRKKPAADGPRYRALGNSFAVPCIRWIGERIAVLR